MNKLFDLIKELRKSCFHGELLLKFTDGRIVLVVKKENVKL